MSAAGAKLLSETLPLLLAGKLTLIPQNERQATFAPNIKREQEKINWTMSGETIYNQIRGLNPWPVAYTTLEGQVLKIWKAEKREGLIGENPGTIIKIETDGFTVSTGNDIAIKVTELQPSGKKKMTSGQFLQGAGAKLTLGMKLGD